ncbi:unnamed protein product [Cyprideis torosa]|uniref:Uncharacterized protein n=1 Tax=Cyprideis torosa TaxID=163714 RepID=A0A7R8WDH9_9CRUS|nr:unnamed protein product [Cyprideis torosa]CAG0894641.1 unnamed protein product [Cyprideis torosa]
MRASSIPFRPLFYPYSFFPSIYSISLTLSCPMNLKLYPLDRQTCSLRMASYGWTKDDLEFRWKEGDPVQIVNNLHLPRFTLEKFFTGDCSSKTNTGESTTVLPKAAGFGLYSSLLKQGWESNMAVDSDSDSGTRTRSDSVIFPGLGLGLGADFDRVHRVRHFRFQKDSCEYSCLKVDLLFKREFSYYLIQIYIPCCMLVIVSWVSFWLDQNAIPARVSLGVTTLLTMSTQTSGINQSLPPVSYTKAIDVWTGVCLTFVFGALLEFALVNYASRSDMHRDHMRKQRREKAGANVNGNTLPWGEGSEHSALDGNDLIEDGGNSFHMQKPLMRGHSHQHFHHHHHPPDGFMPMDKSRSFDMEVQLAPTPSRSLNCCKSWLSKFPTRSKRIDVISRITFPLVFALFNLVYWTTYLFQENQQMNSRPK